MNLEDKSYSLDIELKDRSITNKVIPITKIHLYISNDWYNTISLYNNSDCYINETLDNISNKSLQHPTMEFPEPEYRCSTTYRILRNLYKIKFSLNETIERTIIKYLI